MAERLEMCGEEDVLHLHPKRIGQCLEPGGGFVGNRQINAPQAVRLIVAMGRPPEERLERSAGDDNVPKLLRLPTCSRLFFERHEVAVAEAQYWHLRQRLLIEARKVIRKQLGEQRADTPTVEKGVAHSELELVVAAQVDMKTEERRLPPFETAVQLSIEPLGDLRFLISKPAQGVDGDRHLGATVHNLDPLPQGSVD